MWWPVPLSGVQIRNTEFFHQVCALYFFQIFFKTNCELFRHFWVTWGFLKESFHPALTHTFLQDLIHDVYVNSKPALLDSVLLKHVGAGVHLDGIILFLRDSPFYVTYHWMHDLLSPNGHPVSISCLQCHALKSWLVGRPDFAKHSSQQKGRKDRKNGQNDNAMQEDREVREVDDGAKFIYCSNCKAVHSFAKLPNAFIVTKHGKQDQAFGEWLAQYHMADEGSRALMPTSGFKLRFPKLHTMN